jgi:hypothetical protein
MTKFVKNEFDFIIEPRMAILPNSSQIAAASPDLKKQGFFSRSFLIENKANSWKKLLKKLKLKNLYFRIPTVI